MLVSDSSLEGMWESADASGVILGLYPDMQHFCPRQGIEDLGSCDGNGTDTPPAAICIESRERRVS